MKITNNNTGMIVRNIEPEEFDDAGVNGCTTVHFESTSKKKLWIGLYNDFNDDEDPVHVNVWIEKGKLKVRIDQ